MKVTKEFNYRYAREILTGVAPAELKNMYSVLNNPRNALASKPGTLQRDYSAQIKQWFVSQGGWADEQPCQAVPSMRYDLRKGIVCIEIEIGHQRLVFPDFFKFAADHAKQNVPAGILIVTSEPARFGHEWHCSLASTTNKINSIADWLTVPLLVVGIDP
jgi:Restriction endonuclease BglII.